MIELKIFIFWAVFACLMYVAAKIHFWFTDTNLNWDFFKNDYSYAGALHGVSFIIGCITIAAYLIIKAAMWWFAPNIIW